jgi:hypothetical protein
LKGTFEAVSNQHGVALTAARLDSLGVISEDRCDFSGTAQEALGEGARVSMERKFTVAIESLRD